METLEFHDTPIEDILRLLARQNDLNLIIGPDSMGKVSLRFSGVTLRSALDAILRSKGFQYRLYDNIMLVMKPDSLEKVRGLGMETRLFKLKFSDARDIKSVVDTARVLSPWGYCSIFSRSVSTEAVKAEALRTSSDPTLPSSISIADPLQKGQTPLQTRSDVLLVTDLPPYLEKVSALINQIDKAVKQVAIEVKFVETILNDNQKTGIDWQQLLSVQGGYKGTTIWNLGGAVTAGSSGGSVQFGALDATRFNAILDMLMTSQRSKLLSQPRISTMDNQPASIGVGTTTWIEQRSGDLKTGTLQVTYNERQVPIQLVVVPHILDGGKVLLELRPMVEEVTGWQTGSQGQQLPIISTRTADTRIEVPDGQTAIIGGLLKDRTIWTDKKIWLLGDLPLIGSLFRHKEQVIERTDLSIFITPRIMKDDEVSPFAPPTEVKEVESEGYQPDTTVYRDTTVKVIAKVQAKEVKPVPPEVIDMRDYFPISVGARWTYQWKEGTSSRWISNLAILELHGDILYADEIIPDGNYKSEAHTGYRWDKTGLVHVFKATPGKDSVTYAPARVILPISMEVGKSYENGYDWTLYGIGGQKSALGQVKQSERLLKRESVKLSNARYKDCVVVETIWSDPNDKSGQKKRKLVWYAKGVGPVKVEHDTPLDDDAAKGRMSALLAKRG